MMAARPAGQRPEGPSIDARRRSGCVDRANGQALDERASLRPAGSTRRRTKIVRLGRDVCFYGRSGGSRVAPRTSEVHTIQSSD